MALLETLKRFLLVSSLVTLMVVPNSMFAGEAECNYSLRQLIEAQEFQSAFSCAMRQLEHDPNDVDAILVLARAAQELGYMEQALALSQDARKSNLTNSQLFASYLISGMSAANLGNISKAKLLLLRASDFASLDSEQRVIRQTLTSLRRQSPWRVSYSGNVSPSSNINGGSKHESITLFGLDFPLDEDAKAQAGIAYSAEMTAVNSTRISHNLVWENSLSVSGTVFIGRGRSYWQSSVKSGLRFTPRWQLRSEVYGYVLHDKRYIAETLGSSTYQPYYAQTTLGLEYQTAPTQSSVTQFHSTITNRTAKASGASDALISKFGGSYSMNLSDHIALSYAGYLQNLESTSAELEAFSYGVSAHTTIDLPGTPVTISGNLSYSHSDYKHQIIGYDNKRVDDKIELEISFMNQNVRLFGLRPVYGILLERNISNQKRYDTDKLQFFTGVSSSF